MEMVPNDPETVELLRALEHGEESAHRMLDRYRARLRGMIAARMDTRLSSRVDPSDVVQEAMIQAGGKLPRYLREPRVPVYQWLCSLVQERLIQLRRFHLGSLRRAVRREEPGGVDPVEGSSLGYVDRLMSSGTSPSGRLIREEWREELWAALANLEEPDREILLLRYIHQRPFDEIAEQLAIRPSAAKMRHLRALQRLRAAMTGGGGETER